MKDWTTQIGSIKLKEVYLTMYVELLENKMSLLLNSVAKNVVLRKKKKILSKYFHTLCLDTLYRCTKVLLPRNVVNKTELTELLSSYFLANVPHRLRSVEWRANDEAHV